MRAHRSYVLRCLPVREGTGGQGWRFRIQRAERDAPWHAFRSLEDVAAHLRRELEDLPPGADEIDRGALHTDRSGKGGG